MEKIFRSKEDIEELVAMIRLNLYNHGLPYGPKAIKKKMHEYAEAIVPSESTISRILACKGLTYQRTGWYPGGELNG